MNTEAKRSHTINRVSNFTIVVPRPELPHVSTLQMLVFYGAASFSNLGMREGEAKVVRHFVCLWWDLWNSSIRDTIGKDGMGRSEKEEVERDGKG